MLLALLLMVLTPTRSLAPAVADAPPPQHAYRTELRPRFESFGYAGRMTLIFSEDGYVKGTYRPDTGGGVETVRGGRQGTHIWFDIATLGGIHVEATIAHGVIKGVGAPLGPRTKQYVFTATPIPSP